MSIAPYGQGPDNHDSGFGRTVYCRLRIWLILPKKA